MENSEPKNNESTTVFYATLLSLTEVGLGSILHSLHIPFTGQFLSLNQIALLSHASVNHSERRAPFTISSIAALLKALSPIGKRLTPMLALTVQGLLFTFGIFLTGRTTLGKLLGRCLGAVFASLWSFLQPALIYSIIFGGDIWKALSHINSKYLPEDLLFKLITTIIALKIVLAVVVSIISPRISLQFFKRISISTSITKKKQDIDRSVKKNLLRAAGDLFSVSFLLSFAMVCFLFICTCQESDSLALTILRPIASCFALSFSLRALPVEKLLKWGTHKKSSPFKRDLNETIANITQSRL